MYESDAQSMMFSLAYPPESGSPVGARCACPFGKNKILIGRSDGKIMAYTLPAFSTTKADIMDCGHTPLTDIATDAEMQQIVSCDDTGMIALWNVGNNSVNLLSKAKVGKTWPCTGVQFWNGFIIVASANGVVNVFDSRDLSPCFEIFAHFRTLTSFDVLPCSPSLALLLTASEDTTFRVFAVRMKEDDSLDIEQVAEGTYPNQFICGARFLESKTQQEIRVALSSYECSNVAIFKCKLSP